MYKLKSQVEGFIANGKRFVILNLSEIEYIDSAGIGALLYIRTETSRMGGDFCLVKPNNQNVLQIMQLTSLQKIFTFYEDTLQALKTIREKNGLTATLADDSAAPDDPVHEKLKDYEARINQLEKRLARLEEKIA